MSPKAAYVTLLTVPSYLPGVLVLHASLLAVRAQYPLVVMATPSLSPQVRSVLQGRGIAIRDVDHLQPEEGTHKLEDHDARFRDTWTKLRAFELAEYDRVVMIDADMLIRRNMDELVDLPLEEGWIAAAHVCACNPRKIPHYPEDWVPENCAHTAVTSPTADPPAITPDSPRPWTQLNSGTVVLTPSAAALAAIAHVIATSPLVPTFAFPDQDLLSHHYRGRWRPLSWRYNALKTLRTIHPDEWDDDEVCCVHYILNDKPWKVPRGAGGVYEVMNAWWWDTYEELGREMRETDPEGWALTETYVTHA